MGALEDLFSKDRLHVEGEPIRQILYWRLRTPKASKALIVIRSFAENVVVTASSLPDSHFTFSEDFRYAFSKLCGDLDLSPERTACFEWFMQRGTSNLFSKKYIQFRLTGSTVSREIISERDFYCLINQLSNEQRTMNNEDAEKFTEIQKKWGKLLTDTIIACESVKRHLTIYQIGDIRGRAKDLLEKALPLFDREFINNGDWHELFIVMIGIHGHRYGLTFNEMEELSDRASRLHGLCKQL